MAIHEPELLEEELAEESQSDAAPPPQVATAESGAADHQSREFLQGMGGAPWMGPQPGPFNPGPYSGGFSPYPGFGGAWGMPSMGPQTTTTKPAVPKPKATTGPTASTDTGTGGSSTTTPGQDKAEKGKTAGSGNSGMLDLSGLINMGTIKGALDAIANEPGESGALTFSVKATGKFGTGVVNGMVEGWAKLQLSYSVSDQNFYTLAIDAEGAIGAGIDIAGFIQAKYEVGYGQSFLNKSWKDSEGPAAWILKQLTDLDEATGGELFQLGDAPPKRADGSDMADAEIERSEHKVFHGGEVRGELPGVAKGSVSHQNSTVYSELHDKKDNRVINSKEEHKETNASASLSFGKWGLDVSFTRDWSDTTGSAIYYANGVFDERTLEIGLKLNDLLKKKGGETKIPTETVQNVVLNGFAAVESLFGGLSCAGKLNSKMFDAVVKEIYSQTNRKFSANLGVSLQFNWNYFGESDGELNLMYFRVKVKVQAGVGGKADAKAVGVEGSVTASKSEVVYESLGTETVSYIQRQYVYETKDRPWSDFKSKNKAQIYELVENIATPDTYYYDKDVEAIFDGSNHEQALDLILNKWSSMKVKLDGIEQDVGQVGKELDGLNSWFTWFKSTKNKHMKNVLDIFKKYESDPDLFLFFFTQLPSYNITHEKLLKSAKKTDHLSDWLAIEARGKALEAAQGAEEGA